MKVGIYAKHLTTLGGGEKVAGVMAEILSKRGHSVDLISTFPVEKEEIEKKMAVDLSSVETKPWLERSYNVLEKRTKDYDLFINVSYLDEQPSLSKNSLMYILFPSPVKRTFLGFIKYETLLPLLRNNLIIPEISHGLTMLDTVNNREGKWLKKKNIIVISNAEKKFEIKLRFFSKKVSFNSLETLTFGSPNCRVNVIDKHVEHSKNILAYTLSVEVVKGQSPAIELILKGIEGEEQIALVSLTINNYRFFVWNLIKKYLARYEMALYGSATYKPGRGLNSYSLLISDSLYTKKWTKRYWLKDSVLLYPPVDTSEFFPGRKKNIILNVGRFFVGGHTKRQDIAIKAFKELVRSNKLNKTWELHLAGGVGGGWEHVEYFRKLKEEAKGYPIFFHDSINFSELKKLYAEAKIYWHATGFEIRERTSPIELEHFGITPVEAMAAGAVPMVYRGGGLTETVIPGVGYTWKSIVELKKVTIEIARNESLRKKMAKKAIKRAKFFSRKKFNQEFIKIIENFEK